MGGEGQLIFVAHSLTDDFEWYKKNVSMNSKIEAYVSWFSDIKYMIRSVERFGNHYSRLYAIDFHPHIQLWSIL